MEIRNLQGLCEKTENPRVGGSIPPQATSKPFDNTRGFWFHTFPYLFKYIHIKDTEIKDTNHNFNLSNTP